MECYKINICVLMSLCLGVSNVKMGTVQQVYIKENKEPITGSSIQVICKISGFASTDVANIYKSESKPPTDLSIAPILASCTSSMCLQTAERHTFSSDQNKVSIIVNNLIRSEDQKWWTCAINSQRKEMHLTVYTIAQTLQYDNPPSQDQDLAKNKVMLKCSAGCAYPSPTFKWYYSESGGSRQEWPTSTTVTNKADGCTDSERIYTSTLTLARYTVFSGNTSTDTFKFQCGVVSITGIENQLFTSVSVNIRFAVGPDGPPVIQGYTDGDQYRVIENETGQLTCIIHGGNPLPSLKWNCYNTGTSDPSDVDTVSKTTRWKAGRDQEKTCTCFSLHFTGNESISIQIQTLYKASISSFIEVSHPASNEITVSENSSISLQCKVDSNPGSTIDVLKDGEIKVSKKNTKQISYILSKVSCDTAGIYSCVGYNDHNNEVIKPYRNLRLFVTCSPRLLSPEHFKSNITSASNEEARLQITVAAYPVPKKSEYVWQKRNYNKWETLTTDDTIKINTTDLESTLIILSVKESDFQQYRVAVRNNLGQFQQEFSLIPQPQYKPTVPENITYMAGSLTERSVIIRWNPDHDGGVKQTFILRFKEQGETDWLEVAKEDEGTPSMNITLTGLAERTTFVFQMYSKNVKGSSAFTATSTFTTKKKECTDHDNSAVIVGIVLGLVITVAVAYAIYLTILLKRKHVSTQKEGITKQASSQMYVNLALPMKTRAQTMKQDERENSTATDKSENQYTELDKELKNQESTYDVISSM